MRSLLLFSLILFFSCKNLGPQQQQVLEADSDGYLLSPVVIQNAVSQSEIRGSSLTDIDNFYSVIGSDSNYFLDTDNKNYLFSYKEDGTLDTEANKAEISPEATFGISNKNFDGSGVIFQFQDKWISTKGGLFISNVGKLDAVEIADTDVANYPDLGIKDIKGEDGNFNKPDAADLTKAGLANKRILGGHGFNDYLFILTDDYAVSPLTSADDALSTEASVKVLKKLTNAVDNKHYFYPYYVQFDATISIPKKGAPAPDPTPTTQTYSVYLPTSFNLAKEDGVVLSNTDYFAAFGRDNLFFVLVQNGDSTKIYQFDLNEVNDDFLQFNAAKTHAITLSNSNVESKLVRDARVLKAIASYDLAISKSEIISLFKTNKATFDGKRLIFYKNIKESPELIIFNPKDGTQITIENDKISAVTSVTNGIFAYDKKYLLLKNDGANMQFITFRIKK